jgi:hypothetical protein|tara:strand:+ start:742 stop:1230 length:489 start_codon:yes stop_codon:yes gene_type:complete
MNINDIVILRKHDQYHHRGVIGNRYIVTEIKKTEVKLCAEESNDFCFYTSPDNVEPLVQCTIPSWKEDNLRWIQTRTDSDDFAEKLDEVASKVVNLLKSKNKAYGNTALDPVQIFSRLDATEAICARIDDKIMRIKNKGINDQTEDSVDDLIGYLLLLKMSM